MTVIKTNIESFRKALLRDIEDKFYRAIQNAVESGKITREEAIELLVDYFTKHC